MSVMNIDVVATPATGVEASSLDELDILFEVWMDTDARHAYRAAISEGANDAFAHLDPEGPEIDSLLFEEWVDTPDGASAFEFWVYEMRSPFERIPY